MEGPNPPEGDADTLALARQRIMEHFQYSEEEAMARIMNSIDGIFNEPEVPRPPPAIPLELLDPPPEPPTPLVLEEDGEPRPASKKASFVDFDLNMAINNQVPHTPSE